VVRLLSGICIDLWLKITYTTIVEQWSVGLTISADDPRTIRAIEIAAEADQWLRLRTDDGHAAFGVPSQAHVDQYYVVTRATCDCPDFRSTLLAPRLDESGEPRACKHMLAVRLYTELVKAQQR
jgi:hypothetical protein